MLFVLLWRTTILLGFVTVILWSVIGWYALLVALISAIAADIMAIVWRI